MTPKPKKHGGARPGSGPKPLYGVTKVTLAVRVTPAVRAYLLATGNASNAVEQLIREKPDFKPDVKK